jgi:MYXO-CTERM domain-containing protein
LLRSDPPRSFGKPLAKPAGMRFRITLVVLLAVGFLHSHAGAGTLSVTLTTTPNRGNYAPRNVVAVWIEDAGGTFVKTIGRWAATRRSSLVAWTQKAGVDADAVSGATRANHTAPLTVTWNLKNRANLEVPDGTYTIRMELADRNSNVPADNHQGTFTFVKGPTSSTQNTANGGFNAVAINYSAVAAACNNNVVDVGETCDPPGSCPTSCAASADACAPNVLSGSAAACTAVCAVQAISDCVGGDGCCPGTCTAANDSDCAAGGGDGAGTNEDLTGGCAAGGDGAGALLALLGLGLIATRRRRAA